MESIITVGITGGIGAGKSTICRIIHIMGYPVFYSDSEAKKLLIDDDSTIQSVIKVFGSSILDSGSISNTKLAQIVFSDKDKLSLLNEIIHPRVREKFADWSLRQNQSVVFNEAAILFETGSYLNFTKNILVTSPEPMRIQRLMERDKKTEQEIRLRIQNQWPDKKKIELADFVIQNDEKSMLIPQIITILDQLRA